MKNYQRHDYQKWVAEAAYDAVADGGWTKVPAATHA
jgi:hypothetical protein